MLKRSPMPCADHTLETRWHQLYCHPVPGSTPPQRCVNCAMVRLLTSMRFFASSTSALAQSHVPVATEEEYCSHASPPCVKTQPSSSRCLYVRQRWSVGQAWEGSEWGV